jgi:hypothetical protein
MHKAEPFLIVREHDFSSLLRRLTVVITREAMR